MIRKRIIVIPLINYLYSPQKKPDAFAFGFFYWYFTHKKSIGKVYIFFPMDFSTADNIINYLLNPDLILRQHAYTCRKRQEYVSHFWNSGYHIGSEVPDTLGLPSIHFEVLSRTDNKSSVSVWKPCSDDSFLLTHIWSSSGNPLQKLPCNYSLRGTMHFSAFLLHQQTIQNFYGKTAYNRNTPPSGIFHGYHSNVHPGSFCRSPNDIYP